MSIKEINWVPLPHCPEGQLQQAHSTDAGFDIKIAKTTLVKPYSALAFEWEDVGLKSELELELPDLFKPEHSYELFSTQDGIRTRAKYLVSFAAPSRSLVMVGLNKLGCTSLEDHTETSFLVDSQATYEQLSKIEGVEAVDRAVVVQRKKYKPTLIPTGIKVQPQELMWTGLYLRSSMTKYGISMPHSTGIIDYSYSGELLVGVYPVNGYTLFKAGERIAQLIPMEQFEVRLNQISEEEFVNYNRGGFGSTGKGLRLAA